MFMVKLCGELFIYASLNHYQIICFVDLCICTH